MTDHPTYGSDDLYRACSRARAGNRIVVHGGLYRHPEGKPPTLQDIHASADSPTVVTVGDNGWVSGGRAPDSAWGGGDPSGGGPRKPTLNDPAFLAIDNCSHVVIDGLRLKDFWPTILFIKNCRHVTIRNCALLHGTYAIFARRGTSHLLIEGNSWQQDDTPDHKLWSEYSWVEAHGGEGGRGTLRYFNGGFLASRGVVGHVVVRCNTILDAYNGVRMKSDDPGTPEAGNAHVHIYANDFVRIRDNPIEPEAEALDWHVRHNRLVDCHSWFSVDGVRGGLWYFYGNTGTFTSRQGPPGAPRHGVGRVLKLSYETTDGDVERTYRPSMPWYVFNNSWHLRCPLVGGSNTLGQPGGESRDFTDNLDFFNNAFTWCKPGLDDPALCVDVAALNNFDLARCTGTRFDFSVCDRPDYYDSLADLGGPEANPLPATGPVFIDPRGSDFRLADGSPGLASGRTTGVRQSGRPGRFRLQSDGSLNRGALQDYGLTSIPELEALAEEIAAETPHPTAEV